jgi:DNA helicase-2/ATP-dependent DNA helicase PcrA
MHDEDKVEEERRLLFVGITRAREDLQLSYAQYRAFRGQTCPTVPSPFLMELPRHEMDQTDSLGSRRTTPDWEAGFEPAAHQDEIAQEAAITADDFSQDADESPTRKRGSIAATLTSGLTTAADLLAKQSRPRLSPNVFKHGMTVEHPEYGPGTIVALSGEGPKRNAVVRFFSDQTERTFRLAFSDLTPTGVE